MVKKYINELTEGCFFSLRFSIVVLTRRNHRFEWTSARDPLSIDCFRKCYIRNTFQYDSSYSKPYFLCFTELINSCKISSFDANLAPRKTTNQKSYLALGSGLARGTVVLLVVAGAATVAAGAVGGATVAPTSILKGHYWPTVFHRNHWSLHTTVRYRSRWMNRVGRHTLINRMEPNIFITIVCKIDP